MAADTDKFLGDDGIVAVEVGAQAIRKHTFLRRYVDISRAARRKFYSARVGSATFIDLFCGAGRARVRDSGEWIDGSAIAAWKMSVGRGAPFSGLFIADADDELRRACATRLRALGAPVFEVEGAAVDAAAVVVRQVERHGLHVAFVDPFSLGALDFRILRTLATLEHMDMLVHVSAMDLRRNLDSYVRATPSPLDVFAPGWREAVNVASSTDDLRRQIIEYWRDLISGHGPTPSARMELIRGQGNQPLYWLLLAARHDLAHRFWDVAANVDKQGDLFG